jgi:hypothetical protein
VAWEASAELAEWVELAGLAAWEASAVLAAWVASAEPAVSVELVESVERAASAVRASQEGPAALAESAVPVALAESVGPAAPEVPGSPAPAVPRVRAERVAGTAHGITTPNIAAARPTETARRRTDSVATLAAHPPLRVKRAHANRSAIRAAIFRVTVAAPAAPA